MANLDKSLQRRENRCNLWTFL